MKYENNSFRAKEREIKNERFGGRNSGGIEAFRPLNPALTMVKVIRQ